METKIDDVNKERNYYHDDISINSGKIEWLKIAKDIILTFKTKYLP